MNNPAHIIRNIRISEKATVLSDTQNKYVFEVDPRANKLEIKRAVEQLFKKRVVHVNTCNYQGKKRRERRADFGRTASWKKAIVQLAEGDTIDLA